MSMWVSVRVVLKTLELCAILLFSPLNCFVCFNFHIEHTVVSFVFLLFALLLTFDSFPLFTFKNFTFMWSTWRMSDIKSAHLITTIIAHKGAKKIRFPKLKAAINSVPPCMHTHFVFYFFLLFPQILASALLSKYTCNCDLFLLPLASLS